MKPRATDWTIVIAGSWNLAILNPHWVTASLFESKDIQVEIMIGEGLPKLRMLSGNLSFVPQTDKVIIALSSSSDESMQAAEKIARKLMKLLPVTPISAVGINFGYDELDLPAPLIQLFDLPDTALLADEESAITKTTISRSVTRGDHVLNYRISVDDGSKAQIHLNFHVDVQTNDQALEAVNGRAAQYQQYGEKLLQDVYALELEVEGG